MRLREFASAEEQMALWRLVSDNVWASIGQQVKQERQQRAEKEAQAKTKRKPSGKSIGAVPMPTTKSPKLKLAHAAKPDSQMSKSSDKLANPSAIPSRTQALPTTATSNIKAVEPNAQPAVTAQAPATSAAINASNGSKDGDIWRNTAVQNKVGATADRHSENGLLAKHRQTLRKPIA